MRELTVCLLLPFLFSAVAEEYQFGTEMMLDASETLKPAEGSARASGDSADYSLRWEISIGEDLKALVLSRNLSGKILIHRKNGTYRVGLETGEIVSLELFDFDSDGRAELLTEQVELRGTGILVKQYHVYRVGEQGLGELWRGVAYSHKQLPDPREGDMPAFEIIRGFIRLEPAGGGLPGPRLLHLVEVSQGSETRLERHAFLWEGTSFRELTWPR